MSVFNTIQYGPFEAVYHRESVNEHFKNDLSDFLTMELLSQITIEYEIIKGMLVAVYDNDKNCGPHSAVKDIYKIHIKFIKEEYAETIEEEIKYYPSQRSFSVRRGETLYLWTLARQQQQRENTQKVRDVCDRIFQENKSIEKCPICTSELHIVNTNQLFAVACLTNCFNYDFHRDPKNGEFLHGHFFMGKPQ
ncbi:MAG: hypothetical protein GY795_02450 [Desulfobacterales bacterium]|nr:hypothetical protein [Desulfobacterales bacterium]